MRRGRNDIKNKQDYMGSAYIVLRCIKTKIRDLSFNIQIFLWFVVNGSLFISKTGDGNKMSKQSHEQSTMSHQLNNS
jgi:hypothetical protein